MSEKEILAALSADNVRAHVEHICSNIPSRLAGSDNQRRMADARRIARQLGEFRDQVDGQIIDRVIAKVLEDLQHRAFSGSAQAGDDDEFGG